MVTEHVTARIWSFRPGRGTVGNRLLRSFCATLGYTDAQAEAQLRAVAQDLERLSTVTLVIVPGIKPRVIVRAIRGDVADETDSVLESDHSSIRHPDRCYVWQVGAGDIGDHPGKPDYQLAVFVTVGRDGPGAIGLVLREPIYSIDLTYSDVATWLNLPLDPDLLDEHRFTEDGMEWPGGPWEYSRATWRGASREGVTDAHADWQLWCEERTVLLDDSTADTRAALAAAVSRWTGRVPEECVPPVNDSFLDRAVIHLNELRVEVNDLRNEVSGLTHQVLLIVSTAETRLAALTRSTKDYQARLRSLTFCGLAVGLAALVVLLSRGC